MLKHALVLAALLLPGAFANAHEYSVGELHIAHPWSLQLPPNAPNVAAYFVVHNNGASDDRLLGADSPISDDTQLHEHVQTTTGAMKMQQVKGVEVPAGKDVVFAPSAYHVMLMQPKDRSLLEDGKRFPLTLHFEKAGDVTVQVVVQKQPPAEQAGHAHAH
ncbi:copper chaperone PCu(A)C [Pseudomonas sp. K1(2024)]|uniref:Copper chaperone PCu(A)C n=2 Tax=Pseudomonas TaxID=286 RepID=A0AAI8PA19_9PSED|nr:MULTISPECIES: copper chaperone PCu(A)C [Pseudomonas]AIZ35420.1 copper chaperone [Pseudomonas parafulva]AXO86896.1 copper chaperone PCu(A)C [Pseudomonas parafulva]MDO7904466.1 copper chaperone PCu(A)C [Pseudomonas sp. K13]